LCLGFVLTAVVLAAGLTAKADEAGKPTELPRLQLYHDDRGNDVRLQIGTQLQMEFKSQDRGSHADNVNTTVMRLRSLRPVLTGTMLDGRLSLKLHLNVVPGAFEWLDVTFDYRFRQQFQLRYGVFKMPFTHYRMISKLRLQQVDWAITSKYFGCERQWGFALHNGFDKPPRWGYVLAVGTGENSRASHGIGIAMAYGAELSNTSDLAGDGGAVQFHPELFGQISYNSPGIDISSETDRERTGLRYSVALSGAWDLDPVPTVDFSHRVAPEFLIKFRGLSVTGVAYAGWSEMGEDLSSRLAMRGGLAHVGYRLSDRYEVALRYAAVSMTDDLKEDALVHALLEGTSAWYETWDLKEDYGLVFNIYFLEHQLKLQNGVQFLKTAVDRTDVLVQSQFQLWF